MSTSTVDIDRRPNFCMNRPVWSISTDFWVLWIEPTVNIDRNSPQVESNRPSISTVTNRPVGKVQPTEPTTPVEFSSRAVFFETRKPSVKREVKHSLNPYFQPKTDKSTASSSFKLLCKHINSNRQKWARGVHGATRQSQHPWRLKSTAWTRSPVSRVISPTDRGAVRWS